VSKKLWFGIPGVHMELLPAPSIQSSSSSASYVEAIEFENGGGDIRRSNQFRKMFSFQVSGTVEDYEGINGYSRFASGFHGDGPFFFVDPYTYATNVLPPAWATPALINKGWKNISDITPTFVNTAANTRLQPAKTAVFNLSNIEPITGANSYCTITIPPGKFLHLGASGSATGAAVVRVVPILANNAEDTAVNLTLLSATGSVRMNRVFSGDTYQAVKISMPTTVTPTSVLNLTSMMAQITDSNTTPAISNHIHGEGHTGVEFATPVVQESYVYIDPPRKATAFEMMEVGAWR